MSLQEPARRPAAGLMALPDIETLPRTADGGFAAEATLNNQHAELGASEPAPRLPE